MPLHDTLNHANPKAVRELKKSCPNAAAFILKKKHGKENEGESQGCDPWIIGKAKRKLFAEVKDTADEVLYAVSTDKTVPINPADHEGNI